ncbi:MAG TPA: hypothetical protein VGF90_07985, partial [Verrucomicrobiae bacterium]
MTMSKFKVGLGVLVVAAAAIIFALQHRTQQQLQNDNDLLRQQIAQLKNANQDAPPTTNPTNNDEFNELLRLRGE